MFPITYPAIEPLTPLSPPSLVTIAHQSCPIDAVKVAKTVSAVDPVKELRLSRSEMPSPSNGLFSSLSSIPRRHTRLSTNVMTLLRRDSTLDVASLTWSFIVFRRCSFPTELGPRPRPRAPTVSGFTRTRLSEPNVAYWLLQHVRRASTLMRSDLRPPWRFTLSSFSVDHRISESPRRTPAAFGSERRSSRRAEEPRDEGPA